MSRKTLVLITVLCSLNVGVFYVFNKLQFETVLVGVFREITLFPAVLIGVLSLLLLIISFFTQHGLKP